MVHFCSGFRKQNRDRPYLKGSRRIEGLNAKIPGRHKLRVTGADGLIDELNEVMETETATENYYGENQWLRVYFVDLSGKKIRGMALLQAMCKNKQDMVFVFWIAGYENREL